MLANSGEKNSFCHLKLQGGIVRCLLLGLILPRGKEPFNPISVLGLHTAWQRTPASPCVSGAFFAVKSPSCFLQLIFCLPAHLRKQTPLSCLTTFWQPSFKGVGEKKQNQACQKHTTLSQFKGQCSLSHVNDTEYNAHRRGREGFLLTGPDSGPGRGDFCCDLFSNHPCLYKTQAPVSHDLVS